MNESRPSPPPVRQRPVLGVSGWLLFVCLFLPTLRVCDNPMAPIQFPPDYGLYIGALAIGILGITTVRRRRHHLFVVLLGVWLTSIFVYFSLFVASEAGSGAFVATAATCLVLLVVILPRAARIQWAQTSIALFCVLHALVAVGWSALLAFDPDGMWGAQVSLGASSLMLFGSVAFLIGEAEEARARRQPSIPEARVL